jgi:hypothetical protein
VFSAGPAHSAPDVTPTAPSRPRLATVHAADLLSLRLLLTQHLADLRARGADDAVLAPIEAELRQYGETVEALAARLDGVPRERPVPRRQRPEPRRLSAG